MIQLDLNLLDYQLIFSSILFIILGLLHEWFGFKAYSNGSSMGVFRKNPYWKPESSKERALLGVFYMISFS